MSADHLMSSDNRPFATAAIRIISTTRSHSEISRALDLTPSRTYHHRGKGIESDDERWLLDSELPDSKPIQDHVRHAIDLLWGRREKLAALAGMVEVDIWCTISSPKEFVGFVIEREVVLRAAEMGVEFVVSVYAGIKDERSLV